MSQPNADMVPSPPEPIATPSWWSALQGLDRLPAMRQFSIIMLAAATIALAVGSVLWTNTSDFTLLYGALDESEAFEVVESLNRHQIKHRIDPVSGALLVPAAQVRSIRMRLASEGLPRGDALSRGYELLDEDTGFTTTQRAEESRHRRALEGELSRSIASLSKVQSARVHLAIRQPSAFVRKQERSSASVLLHLYGGGSLADSEVRGIVHLVAASVPDVDPTRVAVIDQQGRLLTAGEGEQPFDSDDERFAFTRRIESNYADRVVDILSPLVGRDGVRAQVTADIDFTESEQTEERFDPATTALRSETLDEESSPDTASGGIPGALSNQPPGATDQAGAAATRNRRSSLRNFEIDRTVSHTRLAPGQLRRLSVAVVVDHDRKVDSEGQVQVNPRSEEEIKYLTTLVRRAVGYSEARGDSVELVSSAFVAEDAPPPEDTPVWEQPWIWQGLERILGALGLLVALFLVLRPTLRNLTKLAPDPLEPKALPPGRGDPLTGEVQPGGQSDQLQKVIGDARHTVSEDPARAAQVLREWVADGS